MYYDSVKNRDKQIEIKTIAKMLILMKIRLKEFMNIYLRISTY